MKDEREIVFVSDRFFREFKVDPESVALFLHIPFVEQKESCLHKSISHLKIYWAYPDNFSEKTTIFEVITSDYWILPKKWYNTPKKCRHNIKKQQQN